MKTFITYLTFIPWILYFITITKNALKDIKKQKITKQFFKDNILKIFHFDTLILISIFVFICKFYKSADQIWLVKVLLFSAINLYLYTNHYYDKNISQNRIGTEDISTILILMIIMISPIIFYSITKYYTITYYILFGFGFFYYIITIISVYINNLLIKIVRRRNNEK